VLLRLELQNFNTTDIYWHDLEHLKVDQIGLFKGFSFFVVFEWFNASGLNGALEVVCIFIANDWKVDTKRIEFQG